jgi:hypothetical protein
MTCPDTACCTCWHARLELGGAFKKTIPLAQILSGQSGCWPLGTGIMCAGASGSGTLGIGVSKTGKASITMHGESDGYCPEGEDCGSNTTWTTFTMPPGLNLVPDPLGTFPPGE